MGEAGAQRYVFAWSPKAQRSLSADRNADNIGLYRILANQASAKARNAPDNVAGCAICDTVDGFLGSYAGLRVAGRFYGLASRRFFSPFIFAFLFIFSSPTFSSPERFMYMPAHFEENRPEVLHRLIAEQSFGALITNGPNGLDANHLPFEAEVVATGNDAAAATDSTQSRLILRAHVARANPIWQEAATNPDALVIFQGPAAYISPTWYPSKHDTHRQVPTYNYMVVHAHGRIVVRDDEAFVRGLVARLTRKMEAGEAVPWKMGDAPADFIKQMLGAIVGIEIEVTRLVGKWKLGQNKEAADRRGAAETLLGRSTDEQQAVGQAMLDAPPAF